MPPRPNDNYRNIYAVLKDVLQRPVQIDSERYRPSTADKRYIEAHVVSERIDPPAGSDAPTITVRWKRLPPHDEYRIDYSDPNIEFHCGWHCDDDHPEYGDVHFQYQHPQRTEPVYEAVEFSVVSPPRILWEVLDRLFDAVIPTKAAPLYDW